MSDAKKRCNSKVNVKTTKLQTGDQILVHLSKVNKSLPPFNAEPYVVIDIKGPVVIFWNNSEKTKMQNIPDSVYVNYYDIPGNDRATSEINNSASSLQSLYLDGNATDNDMEQ